MVAVAALLTACGEKKASEAGTAPVSSPPVVAAPVPVPDNAPPPPPPTIESRIVTWKLHPAEMQDEMSHEHRVTRMRPPTEPLPQYAKADAMERYIAQLLRDDPVLGPKNIEVNVERVVATLLGKAESMEEVGRAIAVALATPGISEVISELTLPADEEIGRAHV